MAVSIADTPAPATSRNAPTQGDCRGFEVLTVTKGHFGPTDLAGCRVALIIDQDASPQQRNASKRLLTGQDTDEMAIHWWVFHAMCDHVHEAHHLPILFEVDIAGRRATVNVGTVLTSTGRLLTPPHAGGDEHRVRIDIPGGIEFTQAEIGSASTTAQTAIRLGLADSYGQWHTLKHGPTGVVH